MKSTRSRPSSQGRYEKRKRNSGGFSLTNPQSERYQSRKEEKKDITVPLTGVVTVASTGASTNFLNPIAQGSTANSHIGRNAHLKSIQWKFAGVMQATTAGASAIRYSIIYDKQSNGTTPAVTDVFLTDDICSPLNLNNNHRFVVLCDEIIECIGTQGPQSFMRSGYRKINLPQEWKGTTNASTDVTTGSIWLYIWQQGTLITLAPLTDFISRVRFTDA